MNDETKNDQAEARIISIDEGRVREHLDGVVREAEEETLNPRLEAEVDVRCGAQRYERSAEWVDTRAGNSERGCTRKPGE
jgi:transposase-like protein